MTAVRTTRLELGARALVALLWLLHLLPMALLVPIGRGFGALLQRLAPSRRRIAERNLQLCFPQWSDEERAAVLREHFRLLGRSIVERGVLWYSSPARLRRLIHIEGDARWAQQHEGAAMWLVPHFLGLEVGGIAVQLFQQRPIISVYQHQRSAVFDRALKRGRLRLGGGELHPRGDSARTLMRRIREGAVFFNLPDQDFGRRDAAFVPFFGIDAATLLAPARLGQMLGLTLQPVIVHMLPGAHGWRVEFHAPWTDWPSGDAVADTARINAFIEAQIRRDPAQYLWVHKRFKTRPEGAPPLYGRRVKADVT